MKINITLPVYNEELILKENILKLYNFLKENLSNDSWKIIIANNGSTDRTAEIALNLVKRDPERLSYLFIIQKGRGGALKTAWLKNPADIYASMDCDLATDLAYFPRLIQALQSGYDLAIGSRLQKGSQTKRSFLRTTTSKIFNFLLKLILKFKIQDSQCGFKAISHQAVIKLLPQVLNNEWFFDTELLFWAQKQGFKIKEIPVQWNETPNPKRKSKVAVWRTALNYLKEIWRLKKYVN